MISQNITSVILDEFVRIYKELIFRTRSHYVNFSRTPDEPMALNLLSKSFTNGSTCSMSLSIFITLLICGVEKTPLQITFHFLLEISAISGLKRSWRSVSGDSHHQPADIFPFFTKLDISLFWARRSSTPILQHFSSLTPGRGIQTGIIWNQNHRDNARTLLF